MILSVPRNTTARILYALIIKGKVSLVDFPYLAGFRTRISELYHHHNVKLIHKVETDVNRDGNSYYYKVHFLPQDEKQNAIEIYKNINKPRIKSNKI